MGWLSTSDHPNSLSGRVQCKCPLGNASAHNTHHTNNVNLSYFFFPKILLKKSYLVVSLPSLLSLTHQIWADKNSLMHL